MLISGGIIASIVIAWVAVGLELVQSLCEYKLGGIEMPKTEI